MHLGTAGDAVAAVADAFAAQHETSLEPVEVNAAGRHEVDQDFLCHCLSPIPTNYSRCVAKRITRSVHFCSPRGDKSGEPLNASHGAPHASAPHALTLNWVRRFAGVLEQRRTRLPRFQKVENESTRDVLACIRLVVPTIDCPRGPRRAFRNQCEPPAITGGLVGCGIPPIGSSVTASARRSVLAS